MTHVDVKNGNVEGALRKFRVQVQRSGVPSEMKKRKEYAKPGVVRREALKEAIKNAKKKNRYNK
ncbi:MAG: 30S ribosomal protein S21 [Bacilli bacterium]